MYNAQTLMTDPSTHGFNDSDDVNHSQKPGTTLHTVYQIDFDDPTLISA
jgi:hypothetical protein